MFPLKQNKRCREEKLNWKIEIMLWQQPNWGTRLPIVSIISHFKPKLFWVLFKNSVHTTKKMQCFVVTKSSWLMLFGKINACLLWESHGTHKYTHWTKRRVPDYSVRTSKRTPHFTITRINWLMLFKETVTVYCDNHMKHINTKYRVIDW
jgi:hypothetical protein